MGEGVYTINILRGMRMLRVSELGLGVHIRISYACLIWKGAFPV